MRAIKDLVKDQTAVFVRYQDGNLMYLVKDFEFPVPLKDLGATIVHSEEKAILLMRYIRKHLELIS